jgi:hypothetical protein
VNNYVVLLLLLWQAIHELKDELEQNHESDVENVKNEIKSKQENQQLKDLQVSSLMLFLRRRDGL